MAYMTIQHYAKWRVHSVARGIKTAIPLSINFGGNKNTRHQSSKGEIKSTTNKHAPTPHT